MNDSADVILIGNSLVSRGNWKELLPNHQVVNWGLGGDELPCTRERSRLLPPGKSRYWVIESGINDLQIYSHDTIIQCFLEIIHMSQLVGAKPILTSIVAVSADAGSHENGREEYREVNTLVQSYNVELRQMAFDHGAAYIDLNTVLTDQEGTLEKQYTTDGVHLSPIAYQIWADSILHIVQ